MIKTHGHTWHGLSAWALAVCALLFSAQAWAGSAALDEAISAYENFEYEDALRLLKKAGAQKSLANHERAQIALYSGLIHFTLGNRDLAAREFEKAIKLDYEIKPPQDTSPKIVAEFEQAREKVPKPEKPKPVPDKKPKGGPLVHKKPTPIPPPAPSKGGRIWTWVALGVGAAALGGGGAFAGLAEKAKDDFDKEEWASSAAGKRDTVESHALTANVLFGVGGAALVAGVILFFVEDDGSNESQEDRSSVSIQPGPLSLQATVRF